MLPEDRDLSDELLNPIWLLRVHFGWLNLFAWSKSIENTLKSCGIFEVGSISRTEKFGGFPWDVVAEPGKKLTPIGFPRIMSCTTWNWGVWEWPYTPNLMTCWYLSKIECNLNPYFFKHSFWVGIWAKIIADPFLDSNLWSSFSSHYSMLPWSENTRGLCQLYM